MNLKNRILVILTVASAASAVVTGAILTFLVQLFGEVTLDGIIGSKVTAIAIGLFMFAGLLIIALLTLLLNKKAIVPAVERNLLENERAMLTEQLHHSQKMEAVGRLAGSIAHDFNNLLTIIDGYSSLIISDPKSEETAQNAKEVVEAARKASFITRKLLSFSQKEQIEPMLVDLNVSLQDIDKMLSRLVGERVALITKPHFEPVHVLTDPVQLGQVLMNLAVNARDAMPNGGRITIKVASRQINDGQCSKPCNIPPGEFAEISVSDTGQGIEPEVMGKMFEAFFTTKERDKGTGLGLSIVKGIMKQNDGFIDVQSKVGGGTTFFLYLPAGDLNIPEEIDEESEVAANPVSEQEKTGTPAEAGSVTILLVEDDPMIRTLVAQTLKAQDYTVLEADEGWEGVKVARQHKGKIDLLFTDVVMPGLGGAELAIAAQELYPKIKVLFMSGYSCSQLEEEGVPPGAAVLEKPFTPDKVISKVRNLLSS
ncbi:ATP-binding protein [Pontiella sulfatireligans]|uniref:histidine kinase n=1 Tax=Pontiella sulfatireligans TaxID=2750658 RepID=A0A6C2UU01_9BACT|nr:ATP-binding protein [Pontiella sulfatireligans]VGO22366.1 Sensor kinase CckA [Pontiella sulfatireligans]